MPLIITFQGHYGERDLTDHLARSRRSDSGAVLKKGKRKKGEGNGQIDR